MKTKKQFASIVRWIARIWATLSLAFLLFMVGAHIIGALSGAEDSNGFNSTSEMLSFLFFPVSTMIGLIVAWKWDGLGGVITIIGIISFHVIRPDLIFNLMIDGLAAPGLLFIIYWLISRGLNKTITPHSKT